MAGAVLEAQDHQDLPFERLVTELNLARELGHNPLFQVSFAFDNTPVPKVALKDLTIEAIEAETTTAMFDLAVDIVDSADGLSISFEYNTDLFFRSTIERLAAHYAVLLDSIVAAPEARIGDLAVLPETERCALLAAGNGATAASVAAWQARSASTVVALAEDSAARFPDQPALIEGETRLTYRELNLRANRLAHRLIGLGAGPEAAVAVYARRSIELTVAILAVSKTGAAYVALDPDYPHERLMHALLSWSGIRNELLRLCGGRCRRRLLASLPRKATATMNARAARSSPLRARCFTNSRSHWCHRRGQGRGACGSRDHLQHRQTAWLECLGCRSSQNAGWARDPCQ